MRVPGCCPEPARMSRFAEILRYAQDDRGGVLQMIGSGSQDDRVGWLRMTEVAVLRMKG